MKKSAGKSTRAKKPVQKAEKAAVKPNVISHSKLESLKSLKLKPEIPQFKAGDRVIVKCRVKEGDKERLQAFDGVVISRKGRGINETFTVRKISSGVGVERVFPLHAPTVAGIEVKVEGFVRRQKLYFLRGLEGKASRIRDKNLKLAEAQGLILGNTSEELPEGSSQTATSQETSGQTA